MLKFLSEPISPPSPQLPSRTPHSPGRSPPPCNNPHLPQSRSLPARCSRWSGLQPLGSRSSPSEQCMINDKCENLATIMISQFTSAVLTLHRGCFCLYLGSSCSSTRERKKLMWRTSARPPSREASERLRTGLGKRIKIRSDRTLCPSYFVVPALLAPALLTTLTALWILPKRGILYSSPRVCSN